MSQDIQKTPPPKSPSALGLMAARMNVDPSKLLDTLKATVFRGCSNEELLALCVVANSYGLNPMLKELYAFPGKNGGIVPMVPIDGWTRIVNRQENYDGVEFAFVDDPEGKVYSCTCTLFIKGRGRPVTVTEFFSECYRKTEPWNGMPRRMLRHKAFIQAARLAFGFSGIHDEDETADLALTMEIPTTRTLTEVTVSKPKENPEPEPEGQATSGAAPTPRDSRDELANVLIEAGFNFDDFTAWGKENFPAMPWDSIGGFDEVPINDAKRFLRAHVGLLKALTAMKGGV